MKLEQSYWPATDDSALLPSTIGSALRDAAERVPDKLALIEGIADVQAQRRWTYKELLADASKVAQALLNQFEPGDHIAVWAANCPEWILLQYGLSLAGMVLVTVNPAYQPSELLYVLKQSRAKAVFHQTQFRANSMTAAVNAVIPELEACKKAFNIDQFDDFLALNVAEKPFPEVTPHDAVMIQYTSGTTGFPKGALLHHHGVTNNARMAAHRRGAGDGTVDISAMPLFHTGGCVVGVLGTLQTLGTLVLLAEFDPQLFLELVEKERAQYTLAVPTMLIALLECMNTSSADLSSLEVVISGGATVPVELVNRIEQEMQVRFSIIFGQTETSPIITMTRLDDDPRDKSESLGQALPQVEVKIIDPESGEVVPVGTTGELCTRGYLVMNGYFEMAEATAATIDQDGWLHSGDLCSMDNRGFCYVEGRLKDMIIRGGENIYPREIEELLFNHPAIADVAVVGVPDERMGEQVAAIVRFNDGGSETGEQLKEYVRSHLAAHKAPKHWAKVDAFPMTQSGKIQKFKLAKMLVQEQLDKI